MKLFCFSDCHGFADELIKSFDKVGFDKNNPNHLLLGLGDYTDRGSQPFEVIQYLKGIKNKCLIIGNHEELLLQCIDRGEYLTYDIGNGTAHTIYDLAKHYVDYEPDFQEACSLIEKPIKHFINGMVNYFETEKYIFVHGFLPKGKDWRYASEDKWEDARWKNGIAETLNGNNTTEKTIVMGHFHTSWARHIINGEPEWGDEANFDSFYGENFIAIDGCTAYSNKVNILVLEDNLLTK